MPVDRFLKFTSSGEQPLDTSLEKAAFTCAAALCEKRNKMTTIIILDKCKTGFKIWILDDKEFAFYGCHSIATD